MRIKNGKHGDVEVLGRDISKGYTLHRVRCLLCGKEFLANAARIAKASVGGCADCRRSAADRVKLERLRASEIGMVYGQLTVTDVYLQNRRPVCKCACQCGRCVDIPLVRLHAGGAKTCGHNSDSNLSSGRRVLASYAIDGTSPPEFCAKLSKANSSGVKGVSRLPDGRYRAYITFKRQQIYLGSFSSLKEAAQARKSAEDIVFGGFCDAVSESDYPELAAYIKRKLKIEK